MNKEIVDMISESDKLDEAVRDRLNKIAPSIWYILYNVFYYGSDIEEDLLVDSEAFRLRLGTGEEMSINVHEVKKRKAKFFRMEEVEYPLFRIIKKDGEVFSILCSYDADDLKSIQTLIRGAKEIVVEKVSNKKRQAEQRVEAVEKIEDLVLGVPNVNENL